MKFLARSLGLLLVAAGFVGLVIDGTRSIVNNEISFSPIGGVLNALVSGGASGLAASLAQRTSPWIGDLVSTYLFHAPAALTGFLLGALLLWLGQKPMEPIGYLAGR